MPTPSKDIGPKRRALQIRLKRASRPKAPSRDLVEFFLAEAKGDLEANHSFMLKRYASFRRGGLNWLAQMSVESDHSWGLTADIHVQTDVEHGDLDGSLKGLQVVKAITRELRPRGYGVFYSEAEFGNVACALKKKLAGVEEARRELLELKVLDLSGRKSRR